MAGLVQTLSEAVKYFVESEWNRKIWKAMGISEPPIIEWQLAHNLPRRYNLGSEIYHFLHLGFTNLLENTNFHTESRMRKVKTSLEGNIQKAELFWDGKDLSLEDIEMINMRYKEGVKEPSMPSRYGTLIAGYCFAQIGGKVRIENFRDGIYVARNAVELPLNERALSERGGK